MPSFPYYTGGFGSNAIDGLYAPGNSGITTNYKADDGTDLGAVCKASMHSSDRRGPVPYQVNGVYTSDLFRDVGFQPVSIDITNYSYNNSYANNLTSTVYASASGTNVNSNNYSVEWKYEYTFGGTDGYAFPDEGSKNSLSTFFTGNLQPFSYSIYVSCTITDLLTGETAIDYAIIDWYMA
jgi:hypothetical protein